MDTNNYKVIETYDGCPGPDATTARSYKECLDFIRRRIKWYEQQGLDLDIVNVQTGRLVSWVL